jgi:hypothetical protein
MLLPPATTTPTVHHGVEMVAESVLAAVLAAAPEGSTIEEPLDAPRNCDPDPYRKGR